MRNRWIKLHILMMILFLSVVGCTNQEKPLETVDGEKDSQKVIQVFASFYPYYDFAKEIGGDHVKITTIVPAGTEPHSFDPSPKTIADLERADIFIYNGLDMEPWVEKVLVLLKGKDIKVIDASKSVELLTLGEEHHGEDYDHEDDDHDHDHGHEEDHKHGLYDPHIWVDPVNAIQISEAIKEAFVDMDPDHQPIYEENYSRFKEELEKLNDQFIEELKDATNRKIIVSHSAFGYLAKRYNIEEIAVAGISPNAEPSPKRLAELTKLAKEHDIKYIFFEALANVKTAEVLANEAGLQVLTLYNIEGLTEEQKNNGDGYISIMYQNLETLKKALVD